MSVNIPPPCDRHDIWARLLWAGLNLGQDDLPVTTGGHFYPIELVRAITLT